MLEEQENHIISQRVSLATLRLVVIICGMYRKSEEGSAHEGNTLDKTRLSLLVISNITQCLDFISLLLVEFITFELQVIHLVSYHLTPLLHVCLLKEKQMLRFGYAS